MKIGFACQYGYQTQKGFEQYKDCKFGRITVKSMSTLSDSQAYDKLTSKVKQNLTALSSLAHRVAKLPEHLRMFRITSELLPLIDHPALGQLYDKPLLDMIRLTLNSTGRNWIEPFNMRVSLHPSQFININSDNPQTVQNSLVHLYWQKFILENLVGTPDTGSVINIHLNGKLDSIPVNEIATLIPWLSFENCDKGFNLKNGRVHSPGLANTIKMCNKYQVRCVMDIHHHLCETGSWISPKDPMIQDVIDTWNGVRPKLHVSQSANSDKIVSAHSDMITDPEIHKLLCQLWPDFDIMVEAKWKNVASESLCQILKGELK